MAEALLRDRLAALGVDATVTSAGDYPGGVAVSPGSVRAMARRGLDIGAYRSRSLTPDMLASTSLIIGMARRHVRSAVALHPATFGHTFTLKELVRRGHEVGPRHPGQSFETWLAELHRGRTPTSLLGEDERDDVADPMGGPDRLYLATAEELAGLIDAFADLAFGSTDKRETA
jgi:protein-tyrosine phosphatase